MNNKPESIISRITAAALGLLIAALALNWAMHLIEAVLPTVIITAVVIVAAMALVRWLRAHWGGW